MRRNFFSHSAHGGPDGAPGLVFCDRLGENQFRSQAKGGGQSGAAIDNSDGDGIMSVIPTAANVKDELGCRQILAIDQHQIEVGRIEFMGSGDSIQWALASY
jgi:hypothetical protein